MRRLALAVALVYTAPAPVAAQDYAGTWIAQQAAVTLAFRQEATGRVTGQLSGNGVTFQLDGQLQGGDVVGYVTSDAGRAYFEASLAGPQLLLILAELDAQGQPNYSAAREVLFVRQAAGSSAPAAPAPAAGNPLARSAPATADPFLGTFTGQGLVLTLARSGNGYSGTLESAGQRYPVTGESRGTSLFGTVQSGGDTFMFEARVRAGGLTVLSDGQTYELAAGTGGTPFASPMAPSSAMNAGDPLSQLLLSSAWCSFSYSQTSGRTNTSRYVFTPDGFVQFGQNSEGGTVNQQGGSTVNLGGGWQGSVYGQSQSGGGARWKVEAGMFYLDQGQGFQPIPLQVTRNSNGYPIVNAAGTEFMQCQ